jgi:cobalt-zinc-cadmium efflux system protein
MHEHIHSHNSNKIGWIILFNLAITAAEYVGGIFSGSLALISDAGHNFSDILSLILSYFGERLSHRKATKKHSFGLKRTEVAVAFINAVSLCGIGLIIIGEAVKRFSAGGQISLGIMLSVAMVGLAGNILSVLVLKRNKDQNLNMRALYLHLFYDALSSVFVIIASIAIAITGWITFDLVASLVIAVMMIWSGLGVMRDALHIFMQGVPRGIDFDEVLNTIASIEGVENVHDLHIWSVNSENIFLSCHACVSEEKHSNEINQLVRKINVLLEERYGINHSAVQFEYAGMCKNGAVCCK